MTRPRLIVGLAIPIALALAIALVLLTHHEDTSPPPATVATSTTPPTTQPPQDQWLRIVRQRNSKAAGTRRRMSPGVSNTSSRTISGASDTISQPRARDAVRSIERPVARGPEPSCAAAAGAR